MSDTRDNKEREDFEAWSRSVAPSHGFERDERGQYVEYPVHAGWAAWQAARRQPHAIGAVPELPAVETLSAALHKIIEMNRQHAEDQYGDAKKAETWACIRVAREALESAGAQPADRAPLWHSPGMGEVHFHDHSLMIECMREIDDPDQDYLADDDLARHVCAALNAAPSPTQSGAQPQEGEGNADQA